VGLKDPAASPPRREVTWREGTKGPTWGRFAWLRARPAHGRAPGDCAGRGPTRLLIQEPADGEPKYASSDLPASPRRLGAVRLWRSRWPVERGDQQMEEELGLGRREGRSWRGFYRHAWLATPAYGTVAPERSRAGRGRPRAGKEGGLERR